MNAVRVSVGGLSTKADTHFWLAQSPTAYLLNKIASVNLIWSVQSSSISQVRLSFGLFYAFWFVMMEVGDQLSKHGR